MLSLPLDLVPLDIEALHLTLSALPIPCCCSSLSEARISFVNPSFSETYGYTVDDFATSEEWMRVFPYPADRERAWSALGPCAVRSTPGAGTKDVSSASEPLSGELWLQGKDGQPRRVLHHGVVLSAAGVAVSTFVDVTAVGKNGQVLPEWQGQADANQVMQDMLLNHSQEMTVISPIDGTHRIVSPAVERITGWTAAEYLSHDIVEMVHPEEVPLILAAREAVLKDGGKQLVRYRGLLKSGDYRWMEALLDSYRDPATQQVIGYVATVRDISLQKEQEDLLALENRHLAKLAQLDELTGIANRRVFYSSLAKEARRHARSARPLAVLLLDVDNFKSFNDSYGHLKGDVCLRMIAQTLQGSLHRVADVVARYGGEEFAMLLPMTDMRGAELIASNAVAAVAALRIEHRGSTFGLVTLSVGVACWPVSRLMNEYELMEQADRALYEAKRAGRNRFSSRECLDAIDLDGESLI